MSGAAMRVMKVALVSIVALIVGGFVWYKLAYPTYTYRYRMTVEVEENGKIHTGSSVIEVQINRQPQVLSAPPIVPHVHGEAVFVDLGRERNVVALLAEGPRAENVDYSYYLIPKLFDLTLNVGDLPKLVNLRGTREVPESYMPTFVTFTGLNDPMS